MSKQPKALLLANILEHQIPSIACLEVAATELRRLHEVNQELLEGLKAILPYVITQSVGCHGYKCREPWCWSCNGEEDAEEAVSKSWLAHDKVKAAIAKAEGDEK